MGTAGKLKVEGAVEGAVEGVAVLPRVTLHRWQSLATAGQLLARWRTRYWYTCEGQRHSASCAMIRLRIPHDDSYAPEFCCVEFCTLACAPGHLRLGDARCVHARGRSNPFTTIQVTSGLGEFSNETESALLLLGVGQESNYQSISRIQVFK